MTSRFVKVVFSAAVLATTLTACQGGYNAQPRAVMFPASEQRVLRSASHWDALAAHEAAAIWQLIPAASLVGLPRASNTHSPFEQAYRNLLTSHLVSSGLQLAGEIVPGLGTTRRKTPNGPSSSFDPGLSP